MDLTKLLAGQESDSEEIQDEILDSESDTDARAPSEPSLEMPNLDSDEDEAPVFRAPKVKEKKNASTFAGMGLDKLLLSNILRKGFKQPTPIQRKSIPAILDGQDVVGMARTGSGKTAAFVLPMIQRLKTHSAKVGARALILSPTRELALQTLRTVKDFGRKSDLRCVAIIGGDSLEDQFGYMMNNPDVIVATPGRFMHLKVEMKLDLSTIEYVVFDEADRLFEMGFHEQLNEILASLPASRQTLLFSATLPSNIVEFARAGLHNPVLVRLDAEQKISDDLQMGYLTVKDNEKDAALLYILQIIIKMPLMTQEQSDYLKARQSVQYDEDGNLQHREKTARPTELASPKSTIVFVPTKHHVEYVTKLLRKLGYAVSYIYGSLDQSARREQLYLFKAGKTTVMVVTDVAARGIDIPLLANVINYNVPSSPRMFVHRVGRTARAGHTGWAYTIVNQADLPYLVDIEVLLGRKLTLKGGEYNNKLVIGAIQRDSFEIFLEQVQSILHRDDDLVMERQVAQRGEKLYCKSRETASKQAAKRAHELIDEGAFEAPNPLTLEDAGENVLASEQDKQDFLARLYNRKSKETVFEFKKTASGSGAEIMARLRKQVAPVQARALKRQEEKAAEKTARADDEKYRDTSNFMSHDEPTGTLQDRGYSLSGSANFTDAAKGLSYNVGNEDARQKSGMHWDKKKGKYVNLDGRDNKKYIRGEDGKKIPASFRSGRYEDWKSAHKTGDLVVGGQENGGAVNLDRKFMYRKEKAPKQADKARNDFKKRQEKVSRALSKGLHVKGHSQKDSSSGLNSTNSIRKARSAKRKRWEKSNQPSKRRS